jgi:hypothetical protein
MSLVKKKDMHSSEKGEGRKSNKRMTSLYLKGVSKTAGRVERRMKLRNRTNRKTEKKNTTATSDHSEMRRRPKVRLYDIIRQLKSTMKWHRQYFTIN